MQTKENNCVNTCIGSKITSRFLHDKTTTKTNTAYKGGGTYYLPVSVCQSHLRRKITHTNNTRHTHADTRHPQKPSSSKDVKSKDGPPRHESPATDRPNRNGPKMRTVEVLRIIVYSACYHA